MVINTKLSARTSNLVRIAVLITMLVGSFGIPTAAHAISFGTIIQVDTISDTISNDGYCSLREAITNANANGQVYVDCDAGSGNDEVAFSSTLGAGTVTLTSTLPAISDSLTIDGGGTITISGANSYQVMVVNADITLNINALTIVNGSTNTSYGGAIVNYGTLNVNNSTFDHNSALWGGAISNEFGANSLNVTNSTFFNNSATYGGGAISNNETAIVANSTFFSNGAPDGGGLRNTRNGGASVGILTVINSTISGNSTTTSGGGIYSDGTLNYTNTIIANSVSGGDCSNTGTIGTNLNNLVKDGSCSPSLSGDPKVGSLADNGGSTQTVALLPGSPAINAGDDTTCSNSPVNGKDQRGLPRPYGAHCDIGAYEYQPPSIIQVNTASDTIANDGTCSLREAITNANANSQVYIDCASGSIDDEITFSNALGTATITLTSALPGVSDLLTIDGTGANITISGANSYRVMFVSSGKTLDINALTIANGSASFTGGGILNYGILNIDNSTFDHNAAAWGGAIHNGGSSNITNSSFSNNSASYGGGAVNNDETVTVTNSTFFNNSSNEGGGIRNSRNNGFSAGILTVTNSTISGNSASTSGGGIYTDGALHYSNTIIANSTSGGDCASTGTISTNTNNLVQDGSCSASLSGDPKLGPLTNNGGPTKTMALLSGSSAIDAGDDTVCAVAPVNNLDQRGVTRPQGAHCDIGAYEQLVQYDGPGKYDDADTTGWVYSGIWTARTGMNGPYLGTIHITQDPAAFVSFTFTGTQFVLFYTKASNRGKIQLFLDGSSTPLVTLNAYSSTITWHAKYKSPTLPPGNHTLLVKNASPSGKYIDVDAIQIH